jgi:hypothetical protein
MIGILIFLFVRSQCKILGKTLTRRKKKKTPLRQLVQEGIWSVRDSIRKPLTIWILSLNINFEDMQYG